jgi:hypothetical protein
MISCAPPILCAHQIDLENLFAGRFRRRSDIRSGQLGLVASDLQVQEPLHGYLEKLSHLKPMSVSLRPVAGGGADRGAFCALLFFGHEQVLKDKVQPGDGILIIEEVPLLVAGKVGRGAA